MHQYNFTSIADKLLVADNVKQMNKLYEYKGRQDLCIQRAPSILKQTIHKALLQSAAAAGGLSTPTIISNASIADDSNTNIMFAHIEALAAIKAIPSSHGEEVAAGYYLALSYIISNYEHLPINIDTICTIHSLLYKLAPGITGGKFKQTDFTGTMYSFVKASDAKDSLTSLCNKLNDALERKAYSPLLLIPIFIVDFLCIHPFKYGSEHLSRLLCVLLLCKCGFEAAKYTSIESIVYRNIDTLNNIMRGSINGWQTNSNNYLPFVRFFLELGTTIYCDFEQVTKVTPKGADKNRKPSKAERIKAVFDKKSGKVKKSDIVEYCPDISLITIERTLALLVEQGYIEKVDKARATGYILVKPHGIIKAF